MIQAAFLSVSISWLSLISSENDDIKTEVSNLIGDREKLIDSIDAKEIDLQNAVQSFRYLADLAEAKDWIAEKHKAAKSEFVGKGTFLKFYFCVELV